MSAPPSPLLADYPVVIVLPVQWGDQDLNAHVNNVVFFRWLESARVEYLHRLGLEHLRTAGLGPILASVRCDFRRQVLFPDTIEVGARVSRLGRTSLGMQHAIVSRSQQLIVAEGDSTMVVFNYAANHPEPLSAELRAAIETLEGRSLG